MERLASTELYLEEGLQDPRGCWSLCKVFLKYGLGAVVGAVLYAAAIGADWAVAVDDWRAGRREYAIATLALVFAPSVVFAAYMFVYSLRTYTGLLAGCRAVTWLLLLPILPLWPLYRSLRQLWRTAAYCCCCCCADASEEALRQLQPPTSAFLLKFLQAFTCSAPQLVVRCVKLLSLQQDPSRPLAEISVAEGCQLGLQLALLGVTMMTSYSKVLSTRQLVEGALEPSGDGLLTELAVFVWWVSFLSCRVSCLALFAYTFRYWTFVLLAAHTVFLFLMQTGTGRRSTVRRGFVLLSSCFLFVFVFLQFNSMSRLESKPLPYVLFAVLCLAEQGGMLTAWFLVGRHLLPNIPLVPASYDAWYTNTTATHDVTYPNSTSSHDVGYSSTASYSESSPFDLSANSALFNTTEVSDTNDLFYGFIQEYDVAVVFTQVLLFTVSVLFMLLTFCITRNSDEDDQAMTYLRPSKNRRI